MRYKELLGVIVLIALGAMVWAKPSLEVAFNKPSLSMTFLPGDSLDSTLIEVVYQGPDRYKPYGKEISFNIDDRWAYARKFEQIGPGHWRVHGRDLVGASEKTYFQDDLDPVKPPRIGLSSLWQATISVETPNSSRFSRGSDSMVVKSESVLLTLH